MLVSILLLLLVVGTQQTLISSFRFENGKPKITYHDKDPEFKTDAAYIYYDTADQHISHFATLTITTNQSYTDDVQAYAAGYLEGNATAEDLFNMYLNVRNVVNESGFVPQNLSNFFYNQDQWVT